ncbi:MAG: dTMP kinase [Betaproteobacteria bacterium]|nr:dTMP kinase [Betaproteobacteria bacterium]
MTPSTGLFISFEGIDGAGKSTHIEAVAQAFEAQGRAVIRTREPGGTPLAERLRELVLNAPMDALTESLLVFAARRDHIAQVIAPALAQGRVVLCDRFSDATFAYQGGGRGFDWQLLQTLEQWVQRQGAPGANLLQPALTLWFDLPASVAAARLATARVPDKFEAQPQAFFEAVASGYARRLAEQPHRFARVDADQPLQAVRAQVLAALRETGFLA